MLEWIKIDHLTPDKPEVCKMADILNVDRDLVFSKLVRVWIWADRYTMDGKSEFNTHDAAVHHIDEVARMEGFALAMQHAKWLVVSEDGRLILPNYTRHNGETAKRRIQNARAAGLYRRRKEK